MSSPSGRLLSLLARLQSRRFWPGPELAEATETHPRTLRRDVERLRELGYAIEATSGPGGGYRFGRGAHLPPLLLSDDEAVLLAVALRAGLASDDVSDRLLPVFAKLETLLPDRLRGKVAALHEQTVVIRGAGPAVDAQLLARLAAACRDSEAVHLRYRDGRGEATVRVVHPLRLARTGNRRWYLVAFDPEKAEWRTLRVDRVEALLGVGPRVVSPPPPDDVAAFVSQAISVAPYACQAVLALEGTLEALSARVPPWIGALRPDGPERCTLAIGGPDWPAVAHYALLVRVPFRVVGPPEAIDAVRAAAAALAAAAGASTAEEPAAILRAGGPMPGSGTKEDPWKLTTPLGTSAFEMYVDPEKDVLHCQVGTTWLHYQRRALEDAHAMLVAHGDWMELGNKDEKDETTPGTVEHWARAADNPVGGWYGLRKGYRGRFASYVMPVLAAQGKVAFEKRGRAICVRATGA